MENKRISLNSVGGSLKDVSLITTGIEAAGHGLYLDEKTAEGVMSKLMGKSLKSYLHHDRYGGDRLGSEMGFFSGIYRAGEKIKASTFEFLESFKRTSGDIVAKIEEMAAKMPDQFGISLVLDYVPVWVLADGSEVRASSPTPPQGALRSIPSMRVLDIISADFVGSPAANPNGLLSKPVDEKPLVETSTPKMTISLADHETKVAELSTKVTELSAQNLAALADVERLTKELAAKSDEHKAALDALTVKLSEAEKYDARKLGVPALEITARQAQLDASAAAPTPKELFEQYQKLEGKERAAFRNKHWEALRGF